jgi:TPR repeat protein
LADALVNQRLLTRARDNYEASHEALLRVAPLGSLILELRSKFLRADMLTMEARDWIEYGRRIEWVARTGERLGDAQTLVADPDFGPLLSASKLGISDYLAACDDKDRQERELRERLDRYELANLTQGVRPQHRLPEPTTNAIPGSETVRGDALRIYISYSRRDVVLSDRIFTALEQAGFDVLLDRTDIAGGEEWKGRLQAIISEADKLVILVSPDSVQSELCRRDLEFAAQCGKTLVPVLVRDVPLGQLPSDLAERNIIFMRNEEEFARGMQALVVTLKTDFDWVREHTRYLQRATEWDSGGRPANRLLSGDDIAEAKAWVARRPKSAPEPTSLHLDFIRASEEEAEARLSKQRKQLEAVAAAQAEREKALRSAEQTLKQAADAQRKRARVRNIAFVIVSILAVLAGYFYWNATQQRGTAEEQRQVAETQTKLAEAQKEQADDILRRATNIIALQAQKDAETKKKVFALFQAGADFGDANSMYKLGSLYENGQGVAQDYARAREWFEKAAARDNADALFRLGLLYENGQGVAQDYARAREWYEKAAARDNADALFRLGLLYENGQGVAQDYAKAREWYEKAAAEGNADAKARLEKLR